MSVRKHYIDEVANFLKDGGTNNDKWDEAIKFIELNTFLEEEAKKLTYSYMVSNLEERHKDVMMFWYRKIKTYYFEPEPAMVDVLGPVEKFEIYIKNAKKLIKDAEDKKNWVDDIDTKKLEEAIDILKKVVTHIKK